MSAAEIDPNKFEIVRHQVAISGRVLDAETGKPISGAEVTIGTADAPSSFVRRVTYSKAQAEKAGIQWEKMTNRPDKALSRTDGLFYFFDLPDGKYELSAKLPAAGKRYGQQRGEATVSRDPKGNVSMAVVDIRLAPRVVKGKVTVHAEKAGVLMATVRVKGSGEQAFTDKDGNYALVGIEPIADKRTKDGKLTRDKRSLEVFAQGFRSATQPFELPIDGDSVTVVPPIKLVRESG